MSNSHTRGRMSPCRSWPRVRGENVFSGPAMACSLGPFNTHVQTQGIQHGEHFPRLDRRFPILELREPLPAHPCTRRRFCLRQPHVLALLAHSGTERRTRRNTYHRQPPSLTSPRRIVARSQRSCGSDHPGPPQRLAAAWARRSGCGGGEPGAGRRTPTGLMLRRRRCGFRRALWSRARWNEASSRTGENLTQNPLRVEHTAPLTTPPRRPLTGRSRRRLPQRAHAVELNLPGSLAGAPRVPLISRRHSDRNLARLGL